MDTVFDRLEAAFERHADKACLVTSGRTWRYADVRDLAGRMAAALAAAGVGAGDRVLVQTDKSPETVALYVATLWRGAVFVPINTAYTAAEVEYFAGDARPAVFVHRSGDLQAAAAAGDVVTFDLAADGSGSLVDAAADATAPEPTPVDAASLASIIYTSGTTGRSKGAMLSHSNLVSNTDVLHEAWGFRPDDVLLHALPIYHVHGLFVALHWAMFGGATMLFMERFDADSVLENLRGASVMMGVPTFYTRLLAQDDFDSAAASGVRLFHLRLGAADRQTFEAFEQRTGQRILERYGMSETVMNTSNPLAGERVAGTVGYPLPGVEVQVVDADDAALPPGEIGEILVRGPNVFSGYWDMPDKTAESFRDDGFFRTGDLGVLDPSGRLSIVGRDKDLVISGGLNVYPKEVERLIDTIPGVAESAVIGVPHEDFGEAVVAVVVADGAGVSEQGVMAALDGQLARFKQPKRVLLVDSLPRNAMGKVQKNQLRDAYRDVLA